MPQVIAEMAPMRLQRNLQQTRSKTVGTMVAMNVLITLTVTFFTRQWTTIASVMVPKVTDPTNRATCGMHTSKPACFDVNFKTSFKYLGKLVITVKRV